MDRLLFGVRVSDIGSRPDLNVIGQFPGPGFALSKTTKPKEFYIPLRTGFTSPDISLQYEVYRSSQITTGISFSYKPSVGDVDSGGDDFSLGIYHSRTFKKNIWSVAAHLSSYGNYTDIQPKGLSIDLKNSLSAQSSVMFDFSDDTDLSVWLAFSQNPFRRLDDSRLFGADTWTAGLDLYKTLNNSNFIFVKVNSRIAGAAPIGSISIGWTKVLKVRTIN